MTTLSNLVNDRAIEIGKLAVRMTTACGSGHPSTALSLAHIVTTLMYHQMRWDPHNPWNPYNDRLVLSEGHAVPIIYAAMADLGAVMGKSKKEARKMTVADVDTLREMNSMLDGHPNPAEGMPFFDAATGSLGMGLSVGCGLALAARKAGIDKKIFVLCGDGESREGQIWEAADFAVDHKITTVCAIINCNGQAQADYVSHQQSQEVVAEKFKAYGWEVRCIDGHHVEEIAEALSETGNTSKPYVIVAATKKGWGVEELKDKSNHGKALPKDKLAAAYTELDNMRNLLGVPANLDVSSFKPAKPEKSTFSFPAPKGKLPAPDFNLLMQGDGFQKNWQAKKKLAARRAYGIALKELAKLDDRIVALDADVSNSTFAEYIKKSDPGKFFECKIAEQSMISTGVGFAAMGYIPFISTFGKFFARAYDQIEMAMISRANIKLVGSHIGITLAADGPSQMGLVDVGFFRSLSGARENGRPMAVILNPADAVCAWHCVQLAADFIGMVYIRTMRPDMSLLYKPDEKFEIGGSKQLLEGSDLLIVASGYMVHAALPVIEQLKQEGIKAGLIDAYCLPMNPEPILAAALKSNAKILTLEDNYIGGVASEVAEIAAAAGNIRVHSLVVPIIPKSGITPEDLLEYCGLSPKDILKAARDLVKK
jgi:transketolase